MDDKYTYDPRFWKILLLCIIGGVVLTTIENCFSQYSENSSITSVIDANQNKLVAVDSPSLTVYTSPCENCTKLPEGFAPMYYSWFEEVTTTKVECTTVATEPASSTPTEPTTPVLPMCDPSLCAPPAVYSKNNKDSFAVCTLTTQVLKEDETKKATWNEQKSDAETAQAAWKESQVNADLQQYCNYYYSTNCAQVPAPEQEKMSNSLSSILGMTPQQIKEQLNKKVKK
jgi:hypothetical protein